VAPGAFAHGLLHDLTAEHKFRHSLGVGNGG
jgi:hypothetical protein